MCIIFFSEKGELPSKAALRVAHENNPDGVGLMYHDGNQVRVVRGLLDFEDTWSLLKLLRGYSYACHFRYRTRGPISSKTCHPFRIREARTGVNTWMMHNGTISGLEIPKGKSDTQVFADHLEGVVNEHGSDVLFDSQVGTNMAKRVGSYNKILFMNDFGQVKIINAKSGFVKGGIWYSNNYSFIQDYRKESEHTSFKKSFASIPTPTPTNSNKKNKKKTSAKIVHEEDYQGNFISDDFSDEDFEMTQDEAQSWLEVAKEKGYVHRRQIS